MTRKKKTTSDKRVDSDVMTEKQNKMDTSMIQLLPTFSGKDEENIKNFLIQFDSIASLTEWSEEQKGIILRTRLREHALDLILKDDDAATENNFPNLKKWLEKTFTKKISLTQAQNKFNNIKHKPNMSVAELVQEIKSNTKQFLGVNTNTKEMQDLMNKVLIAKLLETIRQDIKIELKKENITNFEEAVRKATHLEQIFDEETLEINNVRMEEKRKSQVTPENIELKQLKEQVDRISKLLEQNTQNKPEHKIKFCDICKRPGHNTDDCWYNQKTQNYHAEQNRFHFRRDQRNDARTNYNNKGKFTRTDLN